MRTGELPICSAPNKDSAGGQGQGVENIYSKSVQIYFDCAQFIVIVPDV